MNNNINNNPLDDFSERIKMELENHRLPVDESCWQEIEIQLKPKHKKNQLWLLIPATAAAILLLLFILLPKDEIEIQKNKIVVGAKEKNEKNDSNTNKLVVDNSVIGSKKAVRTISTNENKEFADTENKITKINSTKEIDTKKEDTTEQTTQKEEVKISVKKEDKIILPKKRKNSKLLLSALIGSTESLYSTNNDNNYYLYNLNNVVSENVENNNENILLPANYSNIEHSLPLSFGITLRKNITTRLAVESGIVYTFLSSTLKKVEYPNYKGQLNLHYIGIPLNLIVYLHNSTRWNVYLSGGGMVEKGIKSIYKQSIYKNDKINDVIEKSNIDGLQWSLNGSVGTSYRFYDKWSFYFEPRVSYYFDNNQPMSIRTDKSLIVGANGGFRYEF